MLENKHNYHALLSQAIMEGAQINSSALGLFE